MTDYQHFLEAYKLLEESLKDTKNCTVLDYENDLNRSIEGEKLQVCRILRNYASHHEDGAKFLSYPELTKFLQEEQQKFLSIHTTVGSVVGKQDPITEKTSFKDAFSLLAKSKEGYVPVIDSRTREVRGLLTPTILTSAFAKASRVTEKVDTYLTKAELKRSRNQAEFASSPDIRLDWYAAGTPVILLNAKGQYQKIVQWSKLPKNHGK